MYFSISLIWSAMLSVSDLAVAILSCIPYKAFGMWFQMDVITMVSHCLGYCTGMKSNLLCVYCDIQVLLITAIHLWDVLLYLLSPTPSNGQYYGLPIPVLCANVFWPSPLTTSSSNSFCYLSAALLVPMYLCGIGHTYNDRVTLNKKH